MSFLQCLGLFFVIILPALDLYLVYASWSAIAKLSYAIVKCLGYLCLLDAFPFQFTILITARRQIKAFLNRPLNEILLF